MNCTDDYFEALCWAQQCRTGDQRVGYSIIVDDDLRSKNSLRTIVAVLALPPSVAEDYCKKLARRHGKNLHLLDQHFGTWEGRPGGLSEKQVKERIRAFLRRVQPAMATLAVLDDAEHAMALAAEAEARGFNWRKLEPETHIQQFWKNYNSNQ